VGQTARATLIAASLLLAGCATSAPIGTHPPTAASASRTGSPSPLGSPTPSSIAVAFPLLVEVNCRLPVTLVADQRVGFLDLSNGIFESDPSAPANAQSYSWIAHRWLPAPPEMVAPDGTHYAYAAPDGIHDFDLASGVDRNLLSGATPNQVVEYGAQGIYVTKYGAYAGHLGLWLLDPVTGTLKQLLPAGVAFDDLGSGAAWYSDSRNEVPSPGSLYRIELGTAARTVWFKEPNIWVVHLGTEASGTPLIGYADTRNPDQVTLATMSGPGQFKVIRTGPNATMAWIGSVTDAHGIWFDSNTNGAPLWLLQADDSLVQVAQAAVRPMGRCQ
jgi:hypothetical protein